MILVPNQSVVTVMTIALVIFTIADVVIVTVALIVSACFAVAIIMRAFVMSPFLQMFRFVALRC